MSGKDLVCKCGHENRYHKTCILPDKEEEICAHSECCDCHCTYFEEKQ